MRRTLAYAVLAILLTGCTVDRSVRAWIESRAPDGTIVAGALVEIDGQPAGMTDARGLYHVKIRRRVGEKVLLRVSEIVTGHERARDWAGAFTVSSAGMPVETDGGRIVAVLRPEGS